MTPAEPEPAPAHHNIGTVLTSTPEMPGYFDSSGSPDGPADHLSAPQVSHEPPRVKDFAQF